MVSNADPTLHLVWSYARRFCCEQLFRDQKSGIFQQKSSGLRDPQHIDRLLLVVAIDVLVSSLQGFAVSLSGLRRQLDPHWQRGMSFVRLGLLWIQHSVTNASQRFMARVIVRCFMRAAQRFSIARRFLFARTSDFKKRKEQGTKELM